MNMVHMLSLLVVAMTIQSCGLAFDAIRFVWPIATDEVDAICHRQQLHVGMAIEPFRPFVFPATWTDEGAKVTGLDIELTREITATLAMGRLPQSSTLSASPICLLNSMRANWISSSPR